MIKIIVIASRKIMKIEKVLVCPKNLAKIIGHWKIVEISGLIWHFLSKKCDFKNLHDF